MTDGRVDVWIIVFITLELDGEWSAWHPGRIISGGGGDNRLRIEQEAG
jgi:hypothetical protein